MMNSKHIVPPVLISACLLGNHCRYNGKSYDIPALAESLRQFTVIPVCPEVLGGLPVPRPPAELVDGDGYDVWKGMAVVQTKDGTDLTVEFKEGALKTLKLSEKYGAKTAIFKEHSPSCGSLWIYDGAFNGRLIPGLGVTSALLETKGILVIPEKNWLLRGKSICPANIDG